MRKFILALLLLGLLYSCCEEDYRITGDGQMFIYNDQQQQGDSIRQDSGSIVLEWGMDLEVTAGLDSKVRMPLMAYSCGENYLNKLDSSTFVLHLDRDITLFNGNTLEAGTNLKGSRGVDIYYSIYYGIVYTTLSNDFVRQSLQTDTTYRAEMEIVTTDGQVFSNSEEFVLYE